MNWIKMSDRMPTEADLPLWAAYADGDVCLRSICPPDHYCTHWMPANLPAPPPKEKTQKELDEKAYRSAWKMSMAMDDETVWHAALKWEREQVGAMLNKLCLAVINEDRTTWENLRKRCGL